MSTVQSKRLDGLFEIISFPGSRIFEMRKSDVNGNLLTKASLLAMSKKLEVYEENHTIGTYMIGNNFLSEYLFWIDVEYKTASQDTSLFSVGFDYSKNREMLDSALKMYKMINSIQTPGIVVYAGKVVGNAYSTFAASKVLNENTVLLPHNTNIPFKFNTFSSEWVHKALNSLFPIS